MLNNTYSTNTSKRDRIHPTLGKRHRNPINGHWLNHDRNPSRRRSFSYPPRSLPLLRFFKQKLVIRVTPSNFPLTKIRQKSTTGTIPSGRIRSFFAQSQRSTPWTHCNACCLLLTEGSGSTSTRTLRGKSAKKAGISRTVALEHLRVGFEKVDVEPLELEGMRRMAGTMEGKGVESGHMIIMERGVENPVEAMPAVCAAGVEGGVEMESFRGGREVLGLFAPSVVIIIIIIIIIKVGMSSMIFIRKAIMTIRVNRMTIIVIITIMSMMIIIRTSITFTILVMIMIIMIITITIMIITITIMIITIIIIIITPHKPQLHHIPLLPRLQRQHPPHTPPHPHTPPLPLPRHHHHHQRRHRHHLLTSHSTPLSHTHTHVLQPRRVTS